MVKSPSGPSPGPSSKKPKFRFRRKRSASTAFPASSFLPNDRSTHGLLSPDKQNNPDIQVDEYRPDVAPYPRQHPVKRKAWDEIQHRPQGEQVWTCNLCGMEIRIPPGIHARKKVRANLTSHLMQRHTKDEQKGANTLRTPTQIAVPTHDVPPETAGWTGHLCGKSLNKLSRCLRDASIKKHFELEHADTDPTTAYHQNQREDKQLRECMISRGTHAGQVKQKKQIDELSKWGPQTGHDLGYVVFKDPPPEGFPRKTFSISFLVCATCRRADQPKWFQNNECAGQPEKLATNKQSNLMRKLCQHSCENFDAAFDILKLCESEQSVLGQRPSQSSNHNPVNGQRIGEVSNPGPRGPSQPF